MPAITGGGNEPPVDFAPNRRSSKFQLFRQVGLEHITEFSRLAFGHVVPGSDRHRAVFFEAEGLDAFAEECLVIGRNLILEYLRQLVAVH